MKFEYSILLMIESFKKSKIGTNVFNKESWIYSSVFRTGILESIFYSNSYQSIDNENLIIFHWRIIKYSL